MASLRFQGFCRNSGSFVFHPEILPGPGSEGLSREHEISACASNPARFPHNSCCPTLAFILRENPLLGHFCPLGKTPLIPLPATVLVGLGAIPYFSNLFSNIANLYWKKENKPNKWERRDREICLGAAGQAWMCCPWIGAGLIKTSPKFVIRDQMRGSLMGRF